ncbi:RNA polymerase Rpb5 N-terminal [Arabidopsis thaliana x Arabidopsis arenosa]|uniref:RNA polymerase Rpb5 N-terminal n=1 Tax=Arabidopsis thaliana x Arabidopsis arenosa TaxID=1240361 RepID=A0A8T1ZNZ2_9BRAS|nr:RNA polymerase Rpb5 N-terminal [Arabidopsis thaliana x Arabidopsis arenosa]
MEVKGKETAPSLCLSKYVDPSSEESHRYYLARQNALQMLRDRGYQVSDEDINLSLHDFRAVYGERPDVDRLRISAQHRSDSSKKVKVVFFGTGMVKVNAIRSIAADVLSQETITGLILVLQSHVTKQALKAIELFSFKVEIFQITDLLVNITKHSLKPQHRVLNDEEKTTLLKKFSIEEKQLPRISKKDAIVRYYGLEKGQVVKVNYRGELTESHVAYRCVW